MPRLSIYTDIVNRLENRLFHMEENALLPSEQELAGEFGVSKPTLRRALQVLADNGQIRKLNGVGTLVTKVPQTLARELVFLCGDLAFFAETLQRFGERAGELNYFISVVPLSGDETAQERTVLNVARRKPVGVAVYADPRRPAPAAFHRLAATGVPTLHLMRLPHGIDGNLLEFGNADGMVELVAALYRDGRRNIALYADGLVNPVAIRERSDGFAAGMRKCRLKPDPALLCPDGDDPEAKERFLARFDRPETRPDAVCCLNDVCAGGLIRMLTRRGVDLGAIRFTGFDHTPLSHFIPQPLWTVAPPMAEMGRMAAELLARQVENPTLGFVRRKLRAEVLEA